ncbi:l-Fucosyltransferase [Trichonephila clavipes]|nr:l-Fucosyltransferase [Trichonephila clavipes]
MNPDSISGNDDNRVRVLRPCGEHLNPAFFYSDTPLHRWCDGMGCHCRQYTVICSIDPWHHYSQRYVHDILQPHVLQLMQRLPGAILQQDNAQPHTARVSQYCICTVTTLLGLPDL